MSHLSSATSYPSHRASRTLPPRALGARAARPVHVVVDWSAGGAVDASGHVELEAQHPASARPIWASLERDGLSWEEAIAASRCDEVVLTAQLGDDVGARDLVLGLAEHLTHKLTQTQPLIRVVFLPGRKRA